MRAQRRTSTRKVITSEERERLFFHIAIAAKKTLVLAHCLELDLMASGENEEQATKKLVQLVEAHLTYTIKNNLPVYSMAPVEHWATMQNGKGAILEVSVPITRPHAQPVESFYKHEALELCPAT